MDINLESVTPEKAALYLSMNTKNRAISSSRVKSLAGAMKNGDWQNNGDTIRFDNKGNLIDGQHRLSAIIDCGIDQEMIVVRGLDSDTFTTIDSGKARTAGDILSVDGIKYHHTAASISRLFLNWKKCGNPHFIRPENKPTSTQIYDFAKGNDLLERACIASEKLRKIITPSVMGFVYVSSISDGISEDKVSDFFNRLNQPKPDDFGGVIMMLRDRLMQDKNSKSRMTKQELTAIVIKALRHWLSGSEVKSLRVRTGGDGKEKNLYKVMAH